jgi:Tfp pilus assembly protein PilO
MIDYIALATVGTAIVTGLVWAIRLEGKVDAHEQLFAEREKQSLERGKADAERHDELKDRLVRIESKLDSIAYGSIHRPIQQA